MDNLKKFAQKQLWSVYDGRTNTQLTEFTDSLPNLKLWYRSEVETKLNGLIGKEYPVYLTNAENECNTTIMEQWSYINEASARLKNVKIYKKSDLILNYTSPPMIGFDKNPIKFDALEANLPHKPIGNDGKYKIIVSEFTTAILNHFIKLTNNYIDTNCKMYQAKVKDILKEFAAARELLSKEVEQITYQKKK